MTNAAELRVYLLVRDLQPQFAAYLGTPTRARGYPPFAGQHALIVEVAPALAIERVTDLALRAVPAVEPGILFVERQFGAFAGAAAELSVAFVSKASLATGDAHVLPTRKRRSAVAGCRRIGAADMVRNARLGAVRVDPATHRVTLDGEPVDSRPVDSVPLSRLYLLG